MNDLISRKAVIEAVRSFYDKSDRSTKSIEERIWALPKEYPELDESCLDCPVYDKERRCCPRYNCVIPQALEVARKVKPKTFKVFDTRTGKISDEEYLEYLAGHEEWAFKLCMFDMEQFAIGENGTLYLLDECGRWEYAPEDRFEIRWEG